MEFIMHPVPEQKSNIIIDLISAILDTDSYKTSHYAQYPAGTEHVSSYFESRGGAYDQVVFFGLHYYLQHYLSRPLTSTDIDEAESYFVPHGVPFNRAGWDHIVKAHGGRLPIAIEALPEGTVVSPGLPMWQIVNTDPACPWLTQYLETMLARVWYPTTVATRSWTIKQIIREALELSADNPEAELPFKLHDFGARGASSRETALIGGMAHLVNSQGTDTVVGLIGARKFYGEPMAGFSIPAAEHSTITAWGRNREAQAYRNMLQQFAGPNKIVAVVSDSYNLWEAIDKLWGDELRDDVLNNGGTVVIRPDSGKPAEVVLQTVSALMDKFGYSTNDKGFKVLPPQVRVIQGDGISETSIVAILDALLQHGISASNVAFGMGGELLQRLDRDTCKFKLAASAVCIDGAWHAISKDPITDPGKRSKAGRQAVVKDVNGALKVMPALALAAPEQNQLQPVYRDGMVLQHPTLSDVRARAEAGRGLYNKKHFGHIVPPARNMAQAAAPHAALPETPQVA